MASLDAYRHMMKELDMSCDSLCEQIGFRIEELTNQKQDRQRKSARLLQYSDAELLKQIQSLQFSLDELKQGVKTQHDETDPSDGLSLLVNKAEQSWLSVLWDDHNEYFRYDSTSNRSVQSDQLAGVWFAQYSGLQFGAKFKDKCIKALQVSCLEDVYGDCCRLS